jgi:hypothetical protein
MSPDSTEHLVVQGVTWEKSRLPAQVSPALLVKPLPLRPHELI